MRSFKTASVIVAGGLLALASSGCVVVAEGHPSGDFVGAQAALTWTTEDAWDGAIIDCRSAGANTVHTSLRNLDTGDVFDDLFDCAAEQGTTAELTAGDYAVDAELLDCLDADCNRATALDSVAVWDSFPIDSGGVYDLGHVAFVVNLR